MTPAVAMRWGAGDDGAWTGRVPGRRGFSPACPPKGTDLALRVARQAQCAAKVHQRLVEGRGLALGKVSPRVAQQPSLPSRRARVDPQIDQASQHPRKLPSSAIWSAPRRTRRPPMR